MKIPFFKMSGSGNDFIIVDNREDRFSDIPVVDFVRKVSARRMSAGADGVVLVERSDRADFKWRFYNADGSPADMCGNAARCVARFACIHGIAKESLCFETGAGVIQARVMKDRVKIRMTDPSDPSFIPALSVNGVSLDVIRIHTGVPHALIRVPDVDAVDVVGLGRKIRFHPAFAPRGTNVNFFSRMPDGTFMNRTYERGVENETLACGTASVAVAISQAGTFNIPSPVVVTPRSGRRLTVHFNRTGDRFSDVYLEGDARVIYSGDMWSDAWNWENP